MRTAMTRNCDYSVARNTDGTFSLTRTSGPFPGTVAFIKPILARTGDPTGWQLKPLVTMHGAETAAEAIASTKLMTLAAAKRAVAHASGSTGKGVT
jgi:hypothetical protein